MCWNRKQRRPQVGNIKGWANQQDHWQKVHTLSHMVSHLCIQGSFKIQTERKKANRDVLWTPQKARSWCSLKYWNRWIIDAIQRFYWKSCFNGIGVMRTVTRCSPVVAFLLHRLSRRIKHAVVLTGTIRGHHTASVLVDQTWAETKAGTQSRQAEYYCFMSSLKMLSS